MGHWFLSEKLVIPELKRDEVNTVFQIVIITSSISILSVPFNSVIIAYEHMHIYAYLTIFDTIFKLIIAGVIFIVPDNKLIWYASLMLCTTMIMIGFYYMHVRRSFKNLFFQFPGDKKLFKSLFGFSGWSILGNLAAVGYTQGLNMLLNMFFGPAVNAARSISLQIEQTVRTFIGNFQTAINPQIIKDYARQDYKQMHTLMYRSSKFSVYLLLIFALPITLEADTLLQLWLKQVPEHTVAFVRIMFIVIALETASNSIMTSVVATGDIRNYQIIVSSILLTIVPISYVVLKSGAPPESAFLVYLGVEITAVAARLAVARKLVRLSIRKFFSTVVFRILLVVTVGSIIPIIAHIFLRNTTVYSLMVCVISVVSSAAAIFFCGLTASERSFVVETVHKKIRHE